MRFVKKPSFQGRVLAFLLGINGNCWYSTQHSDSDSHPCNPSTPLGKLVGSLLIPKATDLSTPVGCAVTCHDQLCVSVEGLAGRSVPQPIHHKPKFSL